MIGGLISGVSFSSCSREENTSLVPSSQSKFNGAWFLGKRDMRCSRKAGFNNVRVNAAVTSLR